MCHEWWTRRRLEEVEEDRRLWDEFERTQPLSEAEPAIEERELTLEEREPTPAGTER
jgi:hypothetical protein